MKSAGYATLIFLLALALYWGTAVYFNSTSTPGVAYFNHLAFSFLNGQTYLSNPPDTHDLTEFQGRWYVPFPPLPALLMMPAVALLGVERMNTVFFCAVFGALNVTLVYLLLHALHQQGWSKLALGDQLWLTLLFGLGSVHWYMSTLGSVWFVAQICTVTFVALAVWLALLRRPAQGSAWLAGGALALAMLARPTIVLTWPMLIGIAAQHRNGDQLRSWRALLGWAVASAIPPTLAVVALLAYNWQRFADPLDFGYLTQQVADELASDLHTYGQFHPIYFTKNFWAMWLAGPHWNAEWHFWEPDGQGMSLLFTTPALIYLWRARQGQPLAIGAWLAFGLLLVPLLLYYNTGWYQFGYRFSLDFMIPVMVLLALAAGHKISWAMRVLILAGVVVNAYGVVWWY